MNLSPTSQEKKRGIGPLPMTSMIDVVFLLLIFFMVTATFANEESRLTSALSAEGDSASSSNLEPQILEIRRVDGEPAFVIGSNIARTREQLQGVLVRLDAEQGLVVRPAGDVPVHMIAAAFQAAENAGIKKRSYVPVSD